jgi:cyanobactin maturation PatA/PatG family protease
VTKIAVIDGIPDLECEVFSGASIDIERSMIPEGFELPDRHGTEIFSLIFGTKDTVLLDYDVQGLCLPIFFSNREGQSARAASQVDIARALTIAAERSADIVNVSAGQKSSTNEGGRHLEDALILCQKRRILVVAAAGNDGCACLHVPAAVPTVLAVGAMNDVGLPLDTSNWGDSYSDNGILAPGADLEVIGPKNQKSNRSGTSYAAAVVSKVAGHLLGTAKSAGYDLDPLNIRSILLETADPCHADTDLNCQRVLAGRLNVEAALARLHELGSTRASISDDEVCHVQSAKDREKLAMQETAGSATLTSPFDGRDATTSVQLSAGADKSTVSAEQPSSYPGNAPIAGAPPLRTEVASQNYVNQSACSCGADEETVTKSTVEQSKCSCGCSGKQPPQIVYVLGALWFDFGTEARYDAIVQAMGDSVAANTPSELFDFLSNNLEYASGITFILMQDQIPLYAIQPSGPFALDAYRGILDGLKSSLKTPGDMQRVAIPGLTAGTTRLMNGMVLPILYPDLRGMSQWLAPELVKAAKLAANVEEIDEDPIFNFLMRVYDELRNMGMSPEDRAINFAATNAYQAATAFGDALARNMELLGIDVKKSPICRPDSDCWDVQLQMFDPENERRAGRVYRYTVDVSETLPVTVGPMRAWSAPLRGIL